MSIRKNIFIILLLIYCCTTISAQTYIIKGIVKDMQSGERLGGVRVGVLEVAGKGAATDADGVYSLSLPAGAYTLTATYVSYDSDTCTVVLTDSDIKHDIYLTLSATGLEEVVVSGRRADENVSSPQTGISQLTAKEIALVPVIMGERDILKTMQLLPGVKAASEGSAGFFVRGGTADQNLILLDDVPLYNCAHLMGFFSIFNSDIIENGILYKGSMPARYGERLSSVLEVAQRNGNTQKYEVTGGLGLIASRLNVEGPIQKGKSSFVLGARRTYADALGRLSGIKELKDTYLYFYDLNAKINFLLSNNDNLSLSGYLGRDKLALQGDMANTDWGNMFASLKWGHVFSEKLNVNTSFSVNKYDYLGGLELDDYRFKVSSDILDFSFRHEYTYIPTLNSTWIFGINGVHHTVNPGRAEMSEIRRALMSRRGVDVGIYAQNQWKAGERLELLYGIRFSGFAALGGSDFYILNENRNITDTLHYPKTTEIVKTYFNIEPRLSFSYKVTEMSSVKASYMRSSQNMHLLSYVVSSSPYDRWAMSSNNIKPQIGDQFSLGYFRNVNKNMYEISVETYYRRMKNILDFIDNANFSTTEAPETEILAGEGRAYGIEFLVKKTSGRLTGWLAYTLSKSEKRIEGINNGVWYNAYQDRTHDVSIVLMYELNKKWSLSATWVYYTGNAVTYPSGKYEIDGVVYPYYSERNGYRMPAYHRLDIGATLLLKKTKKITSELAFGLYNAYGRENPYIISFETAENDPTQSKAYQISLFRFIPSITWNFKF
ncbi:MAG: TonB-dependent receptor [Prevotellaceae bacterium]|jgi:hypothetical protein|nr:TonB-dependent receptor [Prevotellaceae bacterium]